MGNATSTPPWEFVDGPSAANYDAHGYVPPGLTYPTQNSWNTARQYPGSMEPANGMPPFKYGMVMSNSALRQWGNRPLNQVLDAPAKWINQPSWTINQDTFNNSPSLCTPENFPNCDVVAMRNMAPTMQLFDGKTYNTMDMYSLSIDDAYTKGYVGGGFDALAAVNENDTSTYDPCDNPSVIETVVPLTAGIAAGTFASRIILPAFASGKTVAGFVAPIVMTGSFVTGWSLGLAQLRGWGDNSAEYKQAAYAIVISAGAVAGAFVADAVNAGPGVQAGVAGGVVYLSTTAIPSVELFLERSGFLTGFLFGLVDVISNGMQRFFCSLSADSFEACADKGEHPTGRRWDVATVAGKLTDEVCEREGWSRDDPRAEFVFRTRNWSKYDERCNTRNVRTVQRATCESHWQRVRSSLAKRRAAKWTKYVGAFGASCRMGWCAKWTARRGRQQPIRVSKLGRAAKWRAKQRHTAKCSAEGHV